MATSPPKPMTAMMAMAEIGNHAGKEPWPSLETAAWVFDRASFVLIGSLVFGVLATVAIVWMGIVKEHHWDLAREAAAKDIASLAIQGDQLRKDTAEANARAAEANRKAEEEKLARLKIEEKLAPRSLSGEQLADIAEKLRLAGQEYRITTFWDLPEPLAIANRIHEVLQSAGWKYLKHETATMLVGGMAGVHVYAHPNSVVHTNVLARALVNLLSDNGVAAEYRDENDPKNPNNIININVGTKP